MIAPIIILLNSVIMLILILAVVVAVIVAVVCPPVLGLPRFLPWSVLPCSALYALWPKTFAKYNVNVFSWHSKLAATSVFSKFIKYNKRIKHLNVTVHHIPAYIITYLSAITVAVNFYVLHI